MLKRLALGFLLGIPASILSLIGFPVSLVLSLLGISEFTSFIGANYLIHVSLNAIFWIVLGLAVARRKRDWVGFAGYIASTLGISIGLAIVVVILILLVILTQPPGL